MTKWQRTCDKKVAATFFAVFNAWVVPPMDLSSFEEARHLVGETDSCLETVRCREHIPLPPQYLGRLRTGIQEVLGSELKMYSERLKGVPVAYSNINLVQTGGNILDDQPYIHLDVEADFIVFRPTVGSTLVGTVNKLGKGHVGCLVHNYFNASIPKPRVALNGWAGSQLAVGDKFPFTVTRIEADYGGVLAITGKILDDTCDSLADTQPASCSTGTPGRGIIKKRKHAGDDKNASKEKKSRETLDTNPHEVSTDAPEDPSVSTVSLVDVSPKRKKKHKKKHREKGDCEVDGSSMKDDDQLLPDGQETACTDEHPKSGENGMQGKKSKHKGSKTLSHDNMEVVSDIKESGIERSPDSSERLSKKSKKSKREKHCSEPSREKATNSDSHDEVESGKHSQWNGDTDAQAQLSVNNIVQEPQSTFTKKKKKKKKEKEQ